MLPPSTSFFSQRTLPSLRSTQSRQRFLSASGLETKIESPQTAGVAPLAPGSGHFHFIPLSRLQSLGSPVSGEVPLKAGPRHCGQFSARDGKDAQGEEKGGKRKESHGRDRGDDPRKGRLFGITRGERE